MSPRHLSRSTPRRRVPGIAIAAIVLIAAGCGSVDEPIVTDATPTTAPVASDTDTVEVDTSDVTAATSDAEPGQEAATSTAPTDVSPPIPAISDELVAPGATNSSEKPGDGAINGDGAVSEDAASEAQAALDALDTLLAGMDAQLDGIAGDLAADAAARATG